MTLAQGEPIEMHEEIVRLRERPLDRAGVLALVEQVKDAFPTLGPVKIQFSRRETRYRGATTWSYRPGNTNFWQHRIKLYPQAMNEKTVLHELAHALITGETGARQNHNRRWKKRFADLLRWRLNLLDASTI